MQISIGVCTRRAIPAELRFTGSAGTIPRKCAAPSDLNRFFAQITNVPEYQVSEKETDNGGVGDTQVDSALVRSALAGQAGGFDELIRRYQRQATVTAYRLLSNRDDAMEVVQDAFMKAFEMLKTLENPNRFGPWFLRIVSNLSLNRRRGRAVRKTVSLESGEEDRREWRYILDDGSLSPGRSVEAADTVAVIREEIDRLPERQREALVLFAVQEMPQKEVAALMDCSVETVKWNVFDARRRLRAALTKRGVFTERKDDDEP